MRPTHLPSPRSAAAAVGLALALTLSACGGNSADSGTDTAAGAASAAPEMSGMSGMGASASTDAPLDQQFLVAMTPHHQSASDMAEIAVQRVKDPRVKALAQRIIDAQGAEIAQMKQIAQADYSTELSTEPMSMTMDMMGMPMTMDMQADIATLESSATPDKTFLELMIPHHASAITMADEEVREGTNAQVKALAQKIKDDQAKEIGEMQQLLSVVA